MIDELSEIDPPIRLAVPNPPCCQTVLTLEDVADRVVFQPDLIVIVSNLRPFGRYDVDSLEAWAFNRDLDAHDRDQPDWLPSYPFGVWT